jgi:hypothetical protein
VLGIGLDTVAGFYRCSKADKSVESKNHQISDFEPKKRKENSGHTFCVHQYNFLKHYLENH